MMKFSLVGVDGNAFNVMGYVRKAMKQVGYNQEDISNYTSVATSGDYDHLLAVSMDWIDKCNQKQKCGDAFATFGPGKYFIGDICYALPDDKYDSIWGDKYKYQDGVYEGFAVHGTAYGDGEYYGSDGVSYSVDAGVIGIVDIGEEQRYCDYELNRLGKIVEVQDCVIMNCDKDGNFEFTVDGKSFEIITDGSDEDDEDDEEEDW